MCYMKIHMFFFIGEILGQMLANKVSKKMYERLNVLCNGQITPESISALTDEEIHFIGTSQQKYHIFEI